MPQPERPEVTRVSTSFGIDSDAAEVISDAPAIRKRGHCVPELEFYQPRPQAAGVGDHPPQQA